MIEPLVDASDLDDSEIEIEIDLKPLPQLVPMKTIFLMANTGEICYTILQAITKDLLTNRNVNAIEFSFLRSLFNLISSMFLVKS